MNRRITGLLMAVVAVGTSLIVLLPQPRMVLLSYCINGIGLQLKYDCAGGSGVINATVTQSAQQSGSGVPAYASPLSSSPGFEKCPLIKFSVLFPWLKWAVR